MPPRPKLEGPLLRPAGEAQARMLRLVALTPWGPAREGWRADFELAELRAELARVAAAGFDAVRLYEAPSRAMLDEFEAVGLGVLVGLPWGWHEVGFDGSRAWWQAARGLFAQAVGELGGHPALWGWIVGNEVPLTVVQRAGWERMREGLEGLVAEVKRLDPEAWCGYANFPPTLPLTPAGVDLVLVNLFLESAEGLAEYLPQLQAWAAGRPLILSEIGLDAQRHGAARQAEFALEAWAVAQQQGLAGWTWFGWSDRWHARAGAVEDWAFGLTTRQGQARPALAALAARWAWEDVGGGEAEGEDFAGQRRRWPRVSVLICTWRGAARIGATLARLRAQTWAEFEVVVVDDGGEEALRQLLVAEAELDEQGCGALRHGVALRYLALPHGGLAAARNRAAQATAGEILVYLDDDSEPQPEYLARLLRGMERQGWDAASGPVQAPLDERSTERQRTLARAPGQAQPVLLGDGTAEHLPGCSLAVRASALAWVGGWDERFRTAGDDVDFCWRLAEAGMRLGFVADALMWHRPRSSWLGYWKQQWGYGRAERLLAQAWPRRVGDGGGLVWRGALYEAEGRATPYRWEAADFPQVYPVNEGQGERLGDWGGRWQRWAQQRVRAAGRRWG